ncbi:GNAT family N-acetyltransferase [Yoonia sp. 208BN28-4]|uniref:GNAT family N-acetyltransferase n=1 Tax=Yoonia sp. 208BN28-4 TaxID=3126505 RepID=UPI0030A817B5
MTQPSPEFQVSLARSDDEIAQAQRLRYDVFIREMGGDGPLVDHAAGRDVDAFDAAADHMVLRDMTRPAGQRIVGVYRLLTMAGAEKAGGFYSASEFDLSPLIRSGRRLLELGRSCVHKDYRGGQGMFQLWSALARYVSTHQIDVLFGVASFHGTDTQAHALPLAYLHHAHLAPAELCPRATVFHDMNTIPADQIDRKAAMRAVPPLIKAYLRLGGMVGAGAFVDHAFNTTDVCLVLDLDRMSDKQRAIYLGKSTA